MNHIDIELTSQINVHFNLCLSFRITAIKTTQTACSRQTERNLLSKTVPSKQNMLDEMYRCI